MIARSALAYGAVSVARGGVAHRRRSAHTADHRRINAPRKLAHDRPNIADASSDAHYTHAGQHAGPVREHA